MKEYRYKDSYLELFFECGNKLDEGIVNVVCDVVG